MITMWFIHSQIMYPFYLVILMTAFIYFRNLIQSRHWLSTKLFGNIRKIFVWLFKISGLFRRFEIQLGYFKWSLRISLWNGDWYLITGCNKNGVFQVTNQENRWRGDEGRQSANGIWCYFTCSGTNDKSNHHLSGMISSLFLQLLSLKLK